MPAWKEISCHISRATGTPFELEHSSSVGGGCINSASRVTDGNRRFFVKTNQAHMVDMFEAESSGLHVMADTATVKVPEPVCFGVAENTAYLVLEDLGLGGSCNSALFGRQLAAMHRVTSKRYGWRIDNTIGSTAQPNRTGDDWVSFWREQRLGFQLNLAAQNGHLGELQSRGERLMTEFHLLFATYKPPASTLHGDLWSGNYGALSDGTPVIFDPAFYYGDREADLAMTTLFGGFDSDFYAAYNEAWPLDDGYRVRKTFYNIYHIINHLNLFGGGYYSQSVAMIESVLAELK